MCNAFTVEDLVLEKAISKRKASESLSLYLFLSFSLSYLYKYRFTRAELLKCISEELESIIKYILEKKKI